MSDIFREKEHFDRAKGIERHLPIRNVFHEALNRREGIPLLRALPAGDLAEFRERIYDVLDRLDSVGFFVHVLGSEIADYRSFMLRMYSPASGVIQHASPTDFVTAQEDVRTGRYALEAIVVFGSSLLETLARAIGLLFGRKDERHLLALRDDLRKRAEAAPQAMAELLDHHEALWQELQEPGFRDRFVNVDTGPAGFADRRLRDVAVHYRALRLSGLQLTVRADGSEDPRAVLEPGAWAHMPWRSNVEWGKGKGILPVCHDVLEELTALVKSAVELACAPEKGSESR